MDELMANSSQTTSEVQSSFDQLASQLEEFLQLATSYRSFLSREYWYRVWIVQEISAAKKVTFTCGTKQISLDHLYASSVFWSHFMSAKARTLLESENEKLRERIGQAIAQDDGFPALAAILKIRAKFTEQAEDGDNVTTLSRLLMLLNAVWDPDRRLQASNPKDKVYGLLGLASDAEILGIRPEYSLSYRDMCVQVAEALFRSQDVSTLGLGPSDEVKDVDPSNNRKPLKPNDENYGLKLPSWVPDWRTTNPPLFGYEKYEKRFSASGSSSLSSEHAFQGRIASILTLRGVQVDTIDQIGTAWSSYDKNWGTLKLHDIVRQIFDEVDQFYHLSLKRGKDPQQAEEARWRVPIGDREMRTRPGPYQRATAAISHEDYKVLRRVQDAMKFGYGDEVTEAFKLLYEAGATRYITAMGGKARRRTFLTKCGYVGLGPASILPEDTICIFLGARAPLALRRTEEDQYRLVGALYVHGIMDGEFMEKGPSKEDFKLC